MLTRNTLVALSLLACGTGLSAQTPSYALCRASSFATAGGLSLAGGELLSAFPPELVRGLGGARCACTLTGMRVVVQARPSASPTPIDFVLRRGDSVAGPATGAAGLLLAIPQQVPASAFEMAWLITAQFATPLEVGCSEFLAAGITIPAASAAALSIYLQGATNAGLLSHPASPSQVWDIPAGAGAARRYAPMAALRVELLTDSSVLDLGAVGGGLPTQFGLGGVAPDTTRSGAASLGLALSITARAQTAIGAVVLVSRGFDPSPFTVPGIVDDCILLDRATMIPDTFALTRPSGVPLEFIASGANLLPAGLGLQFSFQAIVFGARYTATNALGVTLR